MIPPHDSLVKYDQPILVSTTKDNKKGGSKKKTGKVRALTPCRRNDKEVQALTLLSSGYFRRLAGSPSGGSPDDPDRGHSELHPAPSVRPLPATSLTSDKPEKAPTGDRRLTLCFAPATGNGPRMVSSGCST